MTASPKAERIHALDGLRGVACVAVLLLHVATMLELWGESGPYPLIPGTPAVVVFFVLSGVVLSIAPLARLREGRPYDWLGYYPRRVVRLGLPLAAAVALGVVAGLVSWTLGSTGRSATAIDFDGTAPQVVHDVLMKFDVLFFVSDDTVTLFGDPLVRVNSPVWSMGWELWFSLTLPLAVALLARVRREVPAALLIFAGIFLSYWSGYFPLRLCLTFWLGVLLAKHLGELSRVRLTAPIELLVLVLLLSVIELVQACLRWHARSVGVASRRCVSDAHGRGLHGGRGPHHDRRPCEARPLRATGPLPRSRVLLALPDACRDHWSARGAAAARGRGRAACAGGAGGRVEPCCGGRLLARG